MTIREAYESLDEQGKNEFWDTLRKAFQWREGSPMLILSMTQLEIQRLADLLHDKTGIDIEVYT